MDKQALMAALEKALSGPPPWKASVTFAPGGIDGVHVILALYARGGVELTPDDHMFLLDAAEHGCWENPSEREVPLEFTQRFDWEMFVEQMHDCVESLGSVSTLPAGLLAIDRIARAGPGLDAMGRNVEAFAFLVEVCQKRHIPLHRVVHQIYLDPDAKHYDKMAADLFPSQILIDCCFGVGIRIMYNANSGEWRDSLIDHNRS